MIINWITILTIGFSLTFLPQESVTSVTTVTTTSTSTTSTTLYIPPCEYDNQYTASYNADYGWSYENESCQDGVFTTKLYSESDAQELMAQGIIFDGYREIEPKAEPVPLDTCEHPSLWWLSNVQGIDYIASYDDGYSVQVQYTLILCDGTTYDVTGWDNDLFDWANINSVEIVTVDS